MLNMKDIVVATANLQIQTIVMVSGILKYVFMVERYPSYLTS